MDIAQYTALTGISVASSQEDLVEAQIARTQSILESLLGFTLDPDKVSQNLYNELGKSPNECSCSNVDSENLNDPDDVVYAYRVFPYRFGESFLHTDPFTDLHAVKLVRNNVTIKTFDLDDLVIRWKGNWAKYLGHCQGDFNFCYCECDNCVQLAVDADWMWMLDGTLGEIPLDLQNVWAEMVTYYSDLKKEIKSETLGTHSYTRFDPGKVPETLSHNYSVISKYAGPHGSAYKRAV